MSRTVSSSLLAAALLSIAGSSGAVAQIFDFPGAYSQRRDGVGAGNVSPSAAGRKPKEIVVVGSKAKKRQGGKTTSTNDWTSPEASANSGPGVQFNPEQLSRSIQPKSASPDGSTQPYILGPLWNPKSSTTGK